MIVQCKEEAVEKNGYTQTDRLTDRQKGKILTQSSPRTGLGKNGHNSVWGPFNIEIKLLYFHQLLKF